MLKQMNRAAAVPCLLLIWYSVSVAADSETVEYHESRPLGKLPGKLWDRNGLLITYEEAPYDETREIVTDVYANGSRFRRPVWKPIVFHGLPAATDPRKAVPSAATTMRIAESAVAEYNASGNPGRFRAIADGAYVHIVPDGRNRNGTIEDFQPILARRSRSSARSRGAAWMC